MLNNISKSIIIFTIIFILITLLKPKFIYNKNGLLRNFGIGKTNTTILPLWLLVIILSILSYTFILYYQSCMA